MKLKQLTFCFIVLGLSSCKLGVNQNKDRTAAKDTLAYSYKVFKERATDCGNKADSNCTVLTLKYPVFKHEKALNDTVTSRLLSMFSQNDKPDSSFNQLAKHFLTSYQNDKLNRQNKVFYTIDGYAKVLRQDAGLVTIETGGYLFTGGAHGASFVYFINWDTKTNENVTLNDLFNPDYEKTLKNIGEKIFRKDEKLSDTASLANNYFFKNNQFALNDNFLITPTGLHFLYNEYEIKSYAEGITKLFIPYSQIKSLLRPNTVVSQYIK